MRPKTPPQSNYRELSEDLATQLHTLRLKHAYLLRLNQKMNDDKKRNVWVSLWTSYYQTCRKICHR